MELQELRQFAKRMGGDVGLAVMVSEERHEVVDLVAERNKDGETLILIIDKKEGKDA